MGKKEKHCDRSDPADDAKGDCWDHVAFDPRSRLVVSLVVGRRTGEHSQLLVEDFHRRTAGRPMDLMTSDEYAGYPGAIREVYGEVVTPPRTGKPGRPPAPYRAIPDEVTYATVHKTREGNRVVGVDRRLVYGTEANLAKALEGSPVSAAVNTAHVERHNGTDRHRNARKGRKSYCFSKDWAVHQAITYFTMYSYNSCWPVRTLRAKGDDGAWRPRTPAMAAGLADHVWPLTEWVTLPAVHQK